MRNRIDRFSLKNIYGSLVGIALSSLAPFRKAYSIKHRLLCVLFVFVILVPLCSTLIPPGEAFATDPTESGYTFYVPNDGSYLAQLKSAVDSDSVNDSSLTQTAVYVTGRIFGSQQYPMNIEPNESSCAQKGGGGLGHGFGGCADSDSFGGASESLGGNPNLFVYDISYTCDPGVGLSGTPGSFNTGDTNDHYNVTYAVTLSLKDTLFNSSGDLNSQVVMHWAGFTTIQHYAKEQAGVATPPPTNTASKDLPQGCHPPMSPPIAGMYSSSTDTSGTDGAIVDRNIPVTSTSPAGAAAPSGGAGGAGGGAGGSDTSSKDIVCKTSDDILGFIPNPLDWLLCGIVNGMYLIVSNLDTQINNMLEIGTSNQSSDDPNQIFVDTSSGSATQDANAYQAAWTQFRNIALALLVVVGLIIIIAQALGMEILDAYTIRKMLPRVLIATIAITLSWAIMRFLVTLSNDLGYGVQNLLSEPFSGLPVNIQFGAGGSILTAAVAGGALVAFDLFGLLGFVGTALVAVIITFVVLIIRQLAVILLIILAPVAMIAYVLPGTQKYYKFWWESLSKMLLMFPMIVALITTGHIFAAIASSNATTAGPGPTQLADTIIAIFAYFAPYFMVPLTFRFSGSVMGTIGGAVNSRGAGARSALQNFRGNRLKKNMADLKAGNRFEGKKWIPGSTKAAMKFGEASKGIGTGWNGRFGLFERGRDARRNMDQIAGDAAQQTDGMKAVKGWNDVNRVLNMAMGDQRQGEKGLKEHLMMSEEEGGEGITDETVANARVKSAVKAAKVAGGFTKANGIAGFKNMVVDGTAIRDVDDLTELAARAGQGDRNNTFNYAAWGASTSKQVGRHNLGSASQPIGDLAFAKSDNLFNKGEHKLYTGDPSGHIASEDRLSFAANKSAFGGGVGFTVLGNDKGRSVQAGGDFWRKVLTDTSGTYTAKDKQDAAVYMFNQKADIAQGTGHQNNRDRSAKAMAGENNEGTIAYDTYMKAETGGTVKYKAQVKNAEGVVEVVDKERQETNKDLVAKMAGEYRARMSDEERAAMGGSQQQEEEQQQQQQQ
jgi:hypothetical protein